MVNEHKLEQKTELERKENETKKRIENYYDIHFAYCFSRKKEKKT